MLTINEMWQAIIEGNSGISEREFLQSEIRKFLRNEGDVWANASHTI